jgi:type VI secretion system protein ImpM
MSCDFIAAETPVAPWLFGKMPAHGDFISRGLDDETVEAGDAAVAEAVAFAIQRWDMDWDDVYVETPVWRFLAAPGVLGREWLAGVFLSSVDAVGRQFPLLAGFAAPTLALLARPAATTAALDEAESLARAALLEALSVDTVLARLGEIAAAAFAPGAAGEDDPIAQFAGEVLRQLDSGPWGATAIWWVAGGTPDTHLRLEGPLSGEALSRLFRRAPAAELDAVPLSPEDEAVVPVPAIDAGADTPQPAPAAEDAIDTPPPSDAPADAA